MAMRSALALAVTWLAAAPAFADRFGGFSGVDRPYLVNQDKVCAPLSVERGQATGTPTCQRASADVVAQLSFKEPVVQRGLEVTFAASASGRTLTVSRTSGEALVVWQAPDTVGKVVEVYASQYQDRVAVAYTVRRLGKEVTDVVAFELVKTTGRGPLGVSPAPGGPTTPVGVSPAPGGPPSPVVDPGIEKAVVAARKAGRAKAGAAWKAVLALDPDHAEARYRLAAIDVEARRVAGAIAQLGALAASARGDAVEWLVEARYDKAFAGLRADPSFRAAVGLDRPARTPYERLMGFGGRWEQAGTSCEAPEVRLTTKRDRSFQLRVKSACRGQVFDLPFRGTWSMRDDGIVLSLPPAGGQKASRRDEAPCTFEAQGDEDALHCVLDRDLEFVVLPTRR